MPLQEVNPAPNVLGLDVSQSAMGWAVGAEIGVIKPPDGLKGGNRLSYHRDALCDLLDQFKPKLVAFEAYAFQANMAGARNAPELKGVALLLIHDFAQEAGHVEVIDISPSSLKLFSTGSGKCEKDQVRVHVFERWGVKTDLSVDAIDAFMCHQFGAALLAMRDSYPGIEYLLQFQKDSVVSGMSEHFPGLVPPKKVSAKKRAADAKKAAAK